MISIWRIEYNFASSIEAREREQLFINPVLYG